MQYTRIQEPSHGLLYPEGVFQRSSCKMVMGRTCRCDDCDARGDVGKIRYALAHAKEPDAIALMHCVSAYEANRIKALLTPEEQARTKFHVGVYQPQIYRK